jgi:thiol-disulfide isomerase/thioredoxin
MRHSFRARVVGVVVMLLAVGLLGACGSLRDRTGDPTTISGSVFRDLNSDGVRDAREPGEPGVIVSAYDVADTLVATTTTDVNGDYVLGGQSQQAAILTGEQYRVVFSGWADHLSPGPHGQDSGTDQQFVEGGTSGVGFGLSNPDQYVPPQATALAVLTREAAKSESTTTPSARSTGVYAGTEEAPDFPAGLDWLNTEAPLTWDDLRGKVVLMEFWTYGCINCIQTLPPLRMLQKKYADELVIIGVHAAKFPHEAETQNIRQSILRYGLTFPVVNDKDYAIAAQYGANTWPTFVIVNPEGKYLGKRAGDMLYAQLDRLVGEIVAEFDARSLIDRSPLDLNPESLGVVESPLRFPNAVLADGTGDRLFIVDSNRNRIVIANLDGTVRDVIGSGAAGRQDGGFETASFDHPQGVALGGEGALYVADTGNHLLRRADLTDRVVATVAGTGERILLSADAGPALASRLNSPWDVTYADGLVFIAMAGQHQIWVFDPKRERLDLYAGTGTEILRDGPLLQAGLNQPMALTNDGASLYVADSEASAIRQADLDPAGALRTIVGLDFDVYGDVDGRGDNVRMQRPVGIAERNGLLYVADTYNNKIKTVDPNTREARTVLGTGRAGLRDGEDPLFYEPSGLSVAAGKLYVADTNNHVIRVVDLDTDEVSTLWLQDPDQLLSH